MQAELSQMNRIYSGASFTIVATDRIDASYGLRGFQGLTAPWNVRQDSV
jgi:hypothetical protein